MPFVFRHQPIKAIYLIGTVLFLLVVRLPFWTVSNLIPSWRPRSSWSLGRSLLVQCYRLLLETMFNTTLIQSDPPEKAAKSAGALGFVWVDPAPELVVGEIRDLAQINNVEVAKTSGYWFGPRDEVSKVGQAPNPDERVIYHFHGGGYVMGSAHPSNGPMKTCFDGFLEHFPDKTRIFALEYRLSSAPPFGSANPFPAALIDAIAGYRYLVEVVGFDPQNIIISGDSAGGSLAYALARYLAVNKFNTLSNARGLLLLSPTVDWAVTHLGPNSSMEKHSRSDFVRPIFSSGYVKKALLGNLSQDMAATNIWISPGSLKLEAAAGAFAGLPDTCIVSGGAEMTLDPMRTLRDRMIVDLGKGAVTYIETPDATHDFLTASWHEPERTDALRQVAAWVGGL